MWTYLYIAFICCQFAFGIDIDQTERGHILMFHPWGTRSHRMQQNALLEGLLDKGHTVTGVFPHKSHIHRKGYTEVVVKDGFGILINIMTESMMKNDHNNPTVAFSVVPKMFAAFDALLDQLQKDYKSAIQSIEHQNATVDAIVLTTQFEYNGWYLGKHFNCPIITLSPPGPAAHMSKYLGNPENPSYQLEMSLPHIEPLTFSQRLLNVFMYIVWEAIFWKATEFDIRSRMVLEPEDCYSSNLQLLCSHAVTHGPRPYVANTVEVGGIHCRQGEDLPENLASFLDNSPEGVVYVSFGSSVKPSQMSPEAKQVFLDTFRQLKHLVIWKWDEDHIPNLPSNVKLSKWVPQQDLLAHPNLRVFVTHGGLLSIQEALYHQTPLVGIPLGNDQKQNVLRAQDLGYAIMLDWTTLNTTQFLAAINIALDDKDMKKSVKKMHDRFTDQKETPLDRAVWWVEYIIRHDGAPFLRPASLQLKWYQYHLLDVFAFILAVLILTGWLVYKSFKFFFKCCHFGR